MGTSKVPNSPFSYNRKEMEAANTKIFINQSDYETWDDTKNCLIMGSRGAGKSSVLKAFDYRTQWLNRGILSMPPNFKKFFPEIPSVIGIYFRCDNVDVNLWDTWRQKRGADDTRTTLVFSTYIIYVWVEKIIRAIVDISEKFPDVLSDAKANPFGFVDDILDVCYNKKKRPSLYSHSLNHLADTLKETYRSIRQDVFIWRTIEAMGEDYYFHESSSDTLEKICLAVKKHFTYFESSRIFFLMDDVDVFKKWQVVAINSMMKTTSNPYSFKLSSTKDYVTMETFSDTRALSSTDLHVSRLNDDSDSGDEAQKKEMKELFDAILNSRLSSVAELSKPQETYAADKLFGEHDIESLLKATLEKSINTEITNLLKEFENSGEERLTDYWAIEKGFLKKAERDRKEFDKHRISSVLSILYNYNLKGSFIYASSEVIRQITGGSPRNFLKICNSMWETIYETLSKGRSEVAIEDQNKAIRKASDVFFENFNKDQFNEGIDTSIHTMAKRLSSIFKEFIRTESLRITPECLSLKINEDKLLDKTKEEWQSIYDKLIMMEVVKIRRDDDTKKGVVKIALHPMLAPCFCLSYRSPFSYWFTLKEPKTLLTLLTTDNDEADRIIKSIYESRIKVEPQQNLF